MNQKKIIVHDETVENGNEEEKPEKKKPGKDLKPPEDPDEDQEEDIDAETRRPKMKW